MYKKIAIYLVAFLLTLPSVFFATEVGAVEMGSLIKSSESTIYYYSTDGKRYVFPNGKTYLSWYDDFSNITELTYSELAEIPLAGNVTYKPGKKMVKIQTDPKVYAVERGGILRWVKTESIAEALYGTDWNKQIDDIPDVFFLNYVVGNPIESDNGYSPAEELASVPTIDDNKLVAVPTEEPPVQTAEWENFRLTELDTRQQYPNILLQNSNYLIMWSDNISQQDEINTAILTDNNVLNNQTVMSENIYESILANGAWNGTNSILVWEDGHPNRRDISYLKVDVDGNKIFKEKSLTNQTASVNKVGFSKNPQIAWNGESFGSVWWDSRNDIVGNYQSGFLYYQKLTESGQLTGNNIAITSSFSTEFFPDIVWGNDEYGIVWEDDRDGQYDIYFIRIDAEGNIVEDSETKITETVTASTKPVISWNGSSYGVVWQEEVSNSGTEGTHTEIFYQKISASGEKVGVGIRLTTKNSGDSESPKIVLSGTNYGITWADYRNYPNKDNSNIYFIEINSDGAFVVNEENVTNSLGLSFDPNIVLLDGVYTIIYTDNRNGDYELFTAKRE